MLHMWDIFGGNGWWMVFGWIWMVLFWGGLITLIIWGIKKITERSGSDSKDDPLNTARERYASGKISREEFIQIKKDLS